MSVDLERTAHEPRVVVEHASEVLGSAAVEEVALALHLQAGAQSRIQGVLYTSVTQSQLVILCFDFDFMYYNITNLTLPLKS